MRLNRARSPSSRQWCSESFRESASCFRVEPRPRRRLPGPVNWHNVVASESKPESFWLAFVVALHVARPSLSSCSSGRTGRRSSEVCSIPRGPGRSRLHRTARLAPRSRDHPRRHHRSRSRARAARAVLKAARSLDFSHCQRVHPLWRRGRQTPRRGPERRGHLPPGS